jgi:hypothetical protein
MFLPKTGIFCEKTLLQASLMQLQTTSREFFSTNPGFLWEKIHKAVNEYKIPKSTAIKFSRKFDIERKEVYSLYILL